MDPEQRLKQSSETTSGCSPRWPGKGFGSEYHDEPPGNWVDAFHAARFGHRVCSETKTRKGREGSSTSTEIMGIATHREPRARVEDLRAERHVEPLVALHDVARLDERLDLQRLRVANHVASALAAVVPAQRLLVTHARGRDLVQCSPVNPFNASATLKMAFTASRRSQARVGSWQISHGWSSSGR